VIPSLVYTVGMPLADVGGHKIYYESHGQGLGLPLVLIMGLGGSCKGWLPLQVPEFSRHQRTLVFDNRGVGESEDPGGPFSTEDLADDTAGLLDTLGIERAHVLGAFLGGMVAQQLALRHPQRVGRLVLVATYARPDTKRRLLLEQWKGMVEHGMPLEVHVNERVLWGLQDETLEQTDALGALRTFFERDGAPLADDVFVRQIDACLGHDVHDELRRIGAPTLVMCGRQDQLTPPRLHRQIADEIPHARLVTLTYGAHLIAAEAAPRFNEVVSEFLGERDA
jgi:pimeloyl-ACP methyl ester carboxylesterase